MTTASSGFDAEVVETVDPRLKRFLGRLAFACAIAARWWHYHPCELTVRVDDGDYSAAALIVARGPFYAGRYRIAPGAGFAEPLLHLVLFKRSGRLAVLRYLGALLFGRLPSHPHVMLLTGRRAYVAATEALPVQADGEIVGHLPTTFGVADQPLLLIAP